MFYGILAPNDRFSRKHGSTGSLSSPLPSLILEQNLLGLEDWSSLTGKMFHLLPSHPPVSKHWQEPVIWPHQHQSYWLPISLLTQLEKTSIFFLIRMCYKPSRVREQQNPPFLNYGCQLTQADMCSGRKNVIAVSLTTSELLVGWSAGWKINVPFQHKNVIIHMGFVAWNKLWLIDIGDKVLWWRCSSARLRMANDTVTSGPHCLFAQQHPKWQRIGEAHLSYYASAYNRMEINQPPQKLFIRSMWYLVQLLFFSSYNT